MRLFNKPNYFKVSEMKFCLSLIVVLLVFQQTWSQSVGIGTSTPHASAILDINSTNKGMIFPRVSDTSAISNPAKGLVVFSLAGNRLWVFNGNNWEPASGQSSNDSWLKLSDTSIYTRNKTVGINIENSLLQRNIPNLLVNGNFMVQEPGVLSNAQPTAAQTYLLPASAELVIPNDSVFRLQDPGGGGFYPANARSQAYAILSYDKSDQIGWMLSFNSNDFALAAGDSLIISSQPYPLCVDDNIQLLTEGSAVPPEMMAGGGSRLYIIFRSDAATQDKGFDLQIKRIYRKIKRALPPLNNSGNALFFHNGSFGVGLNPVASGVQSTAMGMFARATGANSLALGMGSQAEGKASFALGANALAQTDEAFVFGNTSQALGYGSYVVGANSKSLTTSSMSVGFDLVSKSIGGIVVGIGNDTTDTPGQTARLSDRIFQVGNGLIGGITGRSNALTVLRNGNIGIGVTAPEASLHLKNETGNRRLVLWQTVPGSDLEFFGLGVNDFTMRYNAAANSSHKFYSSNTQVFSIDNQGNAVLRGSLSQNSDIRLKKDFSVIHHSLERLTNIHGYHYRWKDANRDSAIQIGLLAQEVDKEFPQLVTEDKNGIKSVNYSGFTAVLLEAIHELRMKVDELTKEVERMKRERE